MTPSKRLSPALLLLGLVIPAVLIYLTGCGGGTVVQTVTESKTVTATTPATTPTQTTATATAAAQGQNRRQPAPQPTPQPAPAPAPAYDQTADTNSMLYVVQTHPDYDEADSYVVTAYDPSGFGTVQTYYSQIDGTIIDVYLARDAGGYWYVTGDSLGYVP